MNSIIKKTNSGLDHLDIIIADIDGLISNKQDFIAFILIALGIEFMGSFYDEKDFNDFGQSDTRFKNALSNLFKNKWYKNNGDWMFKDFRGPLIHQYRPGDTILLTSNCKNKADLKLHLRSVDGKKIFVLEQLFSDFKLAVQKFNNEIKKASNSLNKAKINDGFMSIVEINFSDQDKILGQPTHFPESSGTTTYNPTVLTNSKKKS
ncbi:hypothetical protein [Lacibacter sediminis]|uniref:Uncharacterized protein n=1 Tax=Lacibacter sediminis TaxID=2760713 RepID=A0A7G5XBU1_9BACT|nr:hypothetical protein [Lacibacter sediminis]QNA42944.1 hypothetical protein H4075_12675 [Lacibacter sediminis]